jgi:hypothetical protein
VWRIDERKRKELTEMRRIWIAVSVVAALLLLGSAVWAAEGVLLDSVDFGTDGTDSGRELSGWGRSATDETGGNYGGIGSGGCRLVWDIDPDDGPDATVLLYPDRGAAKWLMLRHLDGIADDSFDVYVEHDNGTWVCVGHYEDQYNTENWVVTPFDLSTVDLGRGNDFRVKLEATGPQWSGFPTWGQLCIDWVELYGSGAPR